MCELPWPQRDRCRAGLTGHRAHPGVGRSQNVGLLSVNSLTMLPLLDRDLQVASASGTWQRQCKSQEGHSCCWCLGPVNKQPKSEAVPISSTTDPACLIGPARVHLNHGLLCSEDLIHKTPLNCRSGSTGVSGSNARKPMPVRAVSRCLCEGSYVKVRPCEKCPFPRSGTPSISPLALASTPGPAARQ